MSALNKTFLGTLLLGLVTVSLFLSCIQTCAFDLDDNFYRDERRNDNSRQARRSASIKQNKEAEIELGKSLIDVEGNRVRLEQYILRPQADQVKVLALTQRADRLDYMYFLYTFNQALPADFSQAAREGMSSYWTQVPSYWLTEFENKQSNSTDYIKQLAAGGNYQASVISGYDQYFTSLILSINSDANIKQESGYNPATREWTYYYYPGGTKTQAKSWETTWDSANNTWIQKAYDGDFLNGNPTGNLLATTNISSSGNKLQYSLLTTYGDGSFLSQRNYIINDEGKIYSAPSLWSDDYIREILSTGNYQIITRASEFANRDINVVWAPRILINGGLISLE